MKKQMLIALGLCFALFCQRVQAQNEGNPYPLRDTLIIVPNANTKIVLVGYSIDILTQYKRLDSLKTQLITDWEKAKSDSSYPVRPKVTHYFVLQNGKRRLKAENEGYEQTINVREEAFSLALSLPPYVYIIHDFGDHSYIFDHKEYFIYVTDPEKLEELKNINLNDALKKAMEVKSIKKYYKVTIEKINEEWRFNDSTRAKNIDLIEFYYHTGLTLLGGRASPLLGLNVSSGIHDKYGKMAFREQFDFSTMNFIQLQNKEIAASDFVLSYKLKLMFNLNGNIYVNSKKDNFFGLEGGYLNSRTAGWLKNSYMVGLTALNSYGGFSFDFVFNKKKTYYGFTYLIPL